VADVKSTAKTLPSTGPLERYLRAQALSSERAFVAALHGAAVFVRVDERGGADETAPWAVPVVEALPVPHPGVAGDDVFLDLSSMFGSIEATATGPAQPPLPSPRAREHATVYVVPAAGGRIGRDDDAAVRVRERSVSRRHADVAHDDGAWSIVDVGSENGTGVNGMPLLSGEPHALRSGDVVQLADVVLLFLDAAAFYSHLPALAGT
jgi:hypothetical protein